MTPTQEKVYKYVLKYNSKHGEVPSTRVAGEYFGITQQAISLHYSRLIELGLLEKRKLQARFAIPSLTTQM